ncbi:MAG: hypothetical protein E7337_06230, partial [Clostridiales bacterium]|nr:hypothetical protein [Clostridiales bacterium]
GVTTIGEWAFNTCTSLTDVSLPEGLLIIGRNTFSSCTALQIIDLPDSLETVWSYSFAACTNLSSVNYPLNWKNTGTSGSYRYTTPFTDTSVTSIDIPEGVTAIPEYAFKDSKLEQVWMPKTLESFGGETFANCSGMTAYVWSGSPIHYVVEGMAGFTFELRDPHEHEFWKYGDATADCEKDGVQMYQCSLCPYFKSEKIAAYGHDFGMWKTEIPATFIQQGLKARECTRCGLRQEETLPRLDPGDSDDFCDATFRVVNAETLEPISGAHLSVYCYEEGEVTITTDANGYANETLPVGKWMVSAYASGMKVRNLVINVQAGEHTYPDIGLSSKDLVSATLTSKEMTLEEMIAAGIDVSDASNRHLYKYEVKLEFRPGIDALALSGYGGFGLGMFGGWLPNVGGEEPPTTDDEAPDDGDFEKGPGGPLPYPFWEFEKPQGEGSIHKAVYRGEETITVYPVSEKFLLIIYGEVSWLKEMFDVEMVVINGSMTDTFEDGVAALKLPTGLSLAKMRDDLPQQHLVYDIETLAGGEMQSVHWYVRGDEAGTYNITALLEGLMMPFEEEIYQEYECEDAISVLAGNAMELTYHVPNMAYYGEEYPVVAKLKNVSDKILYNVHHDITGSSQKRITVYNDGSEKPDATFTSVDEWHNAYAKKFYPGQTIEASGHVIIAFESELIKEKLKEIRDYAQKLDEYMAMADAVGDIAGKIDDGIGFLDDVNTLLDEEKLPNEKMDVFKQWASDKGMDAFENELEEYFGDGNVDVSKLTDAVCDFIESIPLQFHLVSSEVVVDPISTTYIPTTIETFPATRDPHVASPDVKVEEMVDAFRQEGNLARGAGSHAEAFGKAVGLNNAVSDLTAVGGVQENITVVPAVSNIACKVWSDKNMLTLAVLGADVYTDETLQFTGGGVLKVIPKESEEVYTDTLYIDNGDDTVYTYNVTVYPKHECACTEKTVLVYPTDATDGLAVSLCDVCEQVLSVEELTSCGAHIFGNYELIIAPEDGMYGIKLRECEECYCYEYMIVDENDLQRIIIGLDPNGGEGEMACIDVESGNACILPENGFTYEEMNFICWNTAADGTGTSYLPGDEVTFETACTLYAQWSKTERMDVNLSRAAWSADQMVYDGTEKTVVVEGLPECVEAVYTGNTATEIGEYTASVTFIYDESIYNEPIMPDHTWKVVPAISFKENLDKVYDGYNVGTAYTLAVDGVVAETFYEKTVTGEGEEAVTEWVELDRSPVNAGEYRLDVQITFGDSDYTAFESVEYTISKRPVTLLADDVITVYNGKPQGGTKVGDNLPDGHSVRAVVIEGEAADAGVYKDVLVPVSAVLTDQYGRIATFNYDIDFQTGDLVIEKRPTVVVADDTMHYYDGKAHGGSTATAYNIVTGHTLADPVIEGEATEIGIYEGKLVPTAVTILDEAGADVTDNYLIEWQAGMLEIRQVFAEQILLSVTAMYADTGDSFTAASTVLPENTTDKGILWTTDNAKVAKVDEQGRVTVIAEGTAKITATAADGSGTIAEFTVEARDLATIIPPAALTRIDEEAFIESAVEAVDLSAIDGVEIGDRAFADCAALVKIVLPENAAFGADVFSGTEGVVMYCADDSAVDFALENGFGYVLVAEEAQD